MNRLRTQPVLCGLLLLALAWCSLVTTARGAYTRKERKQERLEKDGDAASDVLSSSDHSSLRLLQVESSCGWANEPCCAGENGTSRCDNSNRFVCMNSTNKCVDCGSTGEPCCETANGPTCDSESLFCSSETKTCTPCGWDSQPCCPQENNVLGCRDSKATTCDLTTPIPMCKYCGGIGQICCAGSKPCDSSLSFCNATNNQCVACGGSNKPCCPDPLGGNVGVCDDNIQRRCVVDGTTFGTCRDSGGKGEVCSNAVGYPACNNGFLFCNSTEKCQSCGYTEESCCPGPDKSTAPGSGTCRDSNYRRCVSNGQGGGICKDCGGNGQTCCSGGKCDSLFTFCNSTGSCSTCGSVNTPCCAGNRCWDDGYQTCQVNHISGIPMCVSCGSNGQPPCQGIGIKACRSEFSTVINGLCTSCGSSGAPCCTSLNPCRDFAQRTCVADGKGGSVCKNCGARGEPCCNSVAGPTCDLATLMCNATSSLCINRV